MKDFKNKVAAITGAGSGIGQQLAVLLAKSGCHLSLSDVNEQGLANTVELTKGTGVTVTTAKVDVANREQMAAWAQQTAQDHGKVNLIFNNAGVALGSTVEGMSYSDLEWLMGINFWGVVYGTKEFLPLIKATRDGHIINISSLFGLTAQPTQSAYNASKFAVRGFTEALRQELDMENCGVSATCVHPGGIKTNIAMAGKVDPSMQKLTGVDAETQKRRANKAINVTTAESAALQILAAVEKNQRRVLVGPDARMIDKIARLLGSWYQPVIMRQLRKMNPPRQQARSAA